MPIYNMENRVFSKKNTISFGDLWQFCSVICGIDNRI